MNFNVSPTEIATAVGSAVTGGALVLGVVAKHMASMKSAITGSERRDPGAPPITRQLAEVAKNTAHTAGVVDQLSSRLDALESRLDEAARDHAEELGRVKGRIDGIEKQVGTVQRQVHGIDGRVHGLERAQGWTSRQAADSDVPDGGR